MFTPPNSNKRILIYKKSKQRQLSEVNLGNTFTNCGLFNKKFASHKKNSTKSSVVHSPFHNSLLSSLNLQIDEEICTMYEYFEIFLGRMMMCRKAAELLGARFKLTANGSKVL